MTTDKIYTTLKQIRDNAPCEGGYRKLCKYLGGVRKYGKDTPVTFRQIYASNGYNDTLWYLHAIDKKWDRVLRHFACDCADDVRHLMKDLRSQNAIDVARRYADGLASDEELDAASSAACSSACSSAWAAACSSAWDAASHAASAVAWDAEREKQIQRLFKYCKTGERVFEENVK